MKLSHQTLIGKIILIIIGIILINSLLVSVGCYGLISQIFLGWEDTTSCFITYDYGFQSEGQTRKLGIMILSLFLIFAVTIFVVYRVWKSIKSKKPKL